MSASGLLDEIDDVGRDPKRGGYSRHAFDAPEHDLREWFVERALGLGLDVETDRNGNIWAWWGPPGRNAVVTGSHLDSVPGGGAFDGPLGVVSALAAEKLDRVLTSDPGMGVIRHVDAGYDRAVEVAEERGVRIPMRE